jgi:hypothetical protein
VIYAESYIELAHVSERKEKKDRGAGRQKKENIGEMTKGKKKDGWKDEIKKWGNKRGRKVDR